MTLEMTGASRRDFIKATTAAGGLVLTFAIAPKAGAAEAGAFRDNDTSTCTLKFRLFHGLTPETETSCFYFWSAANGFRPQDPAATEQLFAEIGAAFAEDKSVVEAQQARLGEFGEDALVDITTDAARIHMRRTMERLLAAEQGRRQAAE